MDEIIDVRLAKVIVEVFHLEDAAVDSKSGADTIDGWDSLGQLGLIMEIEKRFGVKFPTARIVEFDTAGKIQEGLRQLGAL